MGMGPDPLSSRTAFHRFDAALRDTARMRHRRKPSPHMHAGQFYGFSLLLGDGANLDMALVEKTVQGFASCRSRNGRKGYPVRLSTNRLWQLVTAPARTYIQTNGLQHTGPGQRLQSL